MTDTRALTLGRKPRVVAYSLAQHIDPPDADDRPRRGLVCITLLPVARPAWAGEVRS